VTLYCCVTVFLLCIVLSACNVLYTALYIYSVLYTALYIYSVLYTALYIYSVLYTALYIYSVLYTALYIYSVLYTVLYIYSVLYTALYIYIVLSLSPVLMKVRDSDILAWIGRQRKTNQVLGAFRLLHFTMFRPLLAWRAF
jgi:hypothetical protein